MKHEVYTQQNPVIPIAVVVTEPPGPPLERGTFESSSTATIDEYLPPIADYRVRGDRTIVIGAITMIFCCFAGSTMQGFICGYPECCGIFWNVTTCCHHCQFGCATFENRKKSIKGCLCEPVEKPIPTCKFHMQHLFHDSRVEVTCCCCYQFLGSDPDQLYGALVGFGWDVFPKAGCCKTVYEIKSDLEEPDAFKCAFCVPFIVSKNTSTSQTEPSVKL